VQVANGGDAGADVEELLDAGFDHVQGGPAHERLVEPGDVLDARHDPHDLLGQLAVRGEVVPAS
jgi:hypothetical protein